MKFICTEFLVVQKNKNHEDIKSKLQKWFHKSKLRIAKSIL